ncbi:SCO1431 family membrane protein [Streptomyces broussonetiae]|nr:SCO1431 family membrane protein [Streptomyces broussonetiae]
MSKLITAKAVAGGKVDKRVGACSVRPTFASNTMTAHPATATRARTGGPREDGPKILEHVMGWVLVAVFAMLVTQLGLL